MGNSRAFGVLFIPAVLALVVLLIAWRQFPFNDVQIGPADAACAHPDQHLRAGRLRLGHVDELERTRFDRRGGSKNAGFHSRAILRRVRFHSGPKLRPIVT